MLEFARDIGVVKAQIHWFVDGVLEVGTSEAAAPAGGGSGRGLLTGVATPRGWLRLGGGSDIGQLQRARGAAGAVGGAGAGQEFVESDIKRGQQ